MSAKTFLAIPAVSRSLVVLGLFVPTLMTLLGMTMPEAFVLTNSPPAISSIAYGTLNNFDCVNDTGVEAHGFEIELDDIHCTDISYTYDYNHYGVPRITEDLSDPVHPRVFVRYASAKLPDGSWAAYTAIPSGPISPTDGHQFTNPSINFGGEHFGVGYNANPSAVKYNWLIDDGSGNLVHGPPVQVSTPTFTYYPPAGGNPANVVAAIVPPPPPAPPVMQFGEACWVKSIKTTTHNPNKVRLQELVSDDPGMPEPWANGEPAEVEVEWKLLQTHFGAPGGGVNGELEGAPEDLPDGDEVITRRYEFYKYTGPFDAESGEAMADQVGPDDLHGVGEVTFNSYFDPVLGEWVTETVDLTTVIVVGEFFGAQMSGFDVAQVLGMIDNLQDGELNVPYTDRRVVIQGTTPFLAAIHVGSLPPGMSLDGYSGVLSGTPLLIGAYTFTVEALDLSGAYLSHEYTLTITSGANPGSYNITTASSPIAGGTTSGDGTFQNGDEATVTAVPNAGYYFDNWSEGDVHFCFTPVYTFTVTASRDLVANFRPDNVAPVTAHSLAGLLGNHGWYRGPIEVTLNATDNLSGIDTTSYQIDGGAAQVYSAPFMLSSLGAHTVQYWSTDIAQNVEAKKSVEANIDTVSPGVTASAAPPELKPAYGQMVTVTVSGRISDATSGVDPASGAYSVQDSYGLIQPSGTFAIAADGTYSFAVQLEARLAKGLRIPRFYKVNLTALDMAGNSKGLTVTVTVPFKR